ncbi:nuclear transport factor 2 family protein [Sutcliffiella horikoshii]|uniref:YybH family protein n=1 Tax=Sutcliffiella horikoshii TaxID=79883 RepID=UPI001CBB63BF|nr:nuclear transport factor 2 family protein [Sutcliffiella horikoshii]UAL47923.1 nuclear transport factor 2 family protein [Sutcliffiella horikoshii]
MLGVSNVEGILENYKRAIYEKDVESFLAIYDKNVHIYDCWGKWESKGITLWRENVVNWFGGMREEGELLKVDFCDVTIEENMNLAFVHCAVTFAAYSGKSEEKLRQITNRFTFGLKKVNETWLITHEHSSLPIDMETGRGMFDSR